MINKHHKKLKLQGKPFIGHREDAEEYDRDNELILKGYRINFSTFKLIISSLFKIHNETVNVWSHIFGAMIFVGLIFYTLIFLAPPGIHGAIGAGG